MSWRDDDASAQIVDGLMEKEKFDAADAKIADAAKTILSGGDQAWRLGDAKSAAWHALQEQAQKWGVVPDAALRLNECQDAAIPDQKSRITAVTCSSRYAIPVLSLPLSNTPTYT